MMRSAEEAEHNHASRVGAGSLPIANPAAPQDRKQARSYEKQKHDSHVGASLLAISIRSEPKNREGARFYEDQKQAPRLDSVAFEV